MKQHSGNKILKKFVRYLITVVVMALVLEGLLRLFGIGTYEPLQSTHVYHPHHFGEPNLDLGFGIAPGTYEVDIADTLHFSATHNANGQRITSQQVSAQSGQTAVYVYGCSHTYGFGVNDNETYLWQLQSMRPEYAIENNAVSGYGPAQFYLQLKRDFEKKRKPEIVILGYAGFQDERGTMLRNWRKSLAPAVEDLNETELPLFPYIDEASFSDEFEIDFCSPFYEEWPLQRSLALMNALERAYNWFENMIVDSHKVSWLVIDEMAKMCAENDVRFIVLGLDRDKYTYSMLAHCKQQGIEFVDISVDEIPENSLMPFDPHPTARAHRLFALKLADYLQK